MPAESTIACRNGWWVPVARYWMVGSESTRSLARWCLHVAMVLGIVWIALPVIAQEGQLRDIEPATKFLTGNQRERQTALAMSAVWRDGELGNRLRAFSTQQRIGIWVDRRVNPQTEVDINGNQLTTDQFLWKVAQTYGYEVARVEEIYYLGPADAASQLPILMDRLSKEALRNRKRYRLDWREPQSTVTREVVEPRQLLLELANRHQFEIQGMDQIPFDVWAGIELPATTLQGRIQLLLIGFNKTFQRNEDGSSIQIVDLPMIASAEREFVVAQTDRQVDRLRARFPSLKLNNRGKRLIAVGSPRQLAELESALVSGQQAIGSADAGKTFTLTTTAQRGSILAAIAQQTGTELVFGADQQESLLERVSIDVAEVSLEELFKAVFEGTTLSARMDDGKLQVTGKLPLPENQ